MYKALEDLVELVVDGEYDDLSLLSGDAELKPEELRRRVEDDCPEALAPPPRSHYVVETIAKSDEPATPASPSSWTCGRTRARPSCTSRASCTRRATAST